MAAIKNQELDLANLEDLEHLKQLVLKRSQNSREIRHASHIIRRLLIDGDLAKSTSPRGIKLIFVAPDNKPLIQIASHKIVVFWLSGGCNAFGTMLRGILIALDEGPPPYEFDGIATIDLSLASYLKQPVFYLKSIFITRQDVIKFVANKAGGAHFDTKRDSEIHQIIERIRASIVCSPHQNHSCQIECNLETLEAFDKPLPVNLPPAQAVDIIFFEFYAACHFLIHSPVVINLMTELKRELSR